MNLLNIVKTRLGIYYDDPAKDAEINSLVESAKEFATSAGVPASSENSPLYADLIALVCKEIYQETYRLTGNDFIIAIIGQLRN